MRILLTLTLLLLAGCQFGSVNQGQVIDYQRATGQITLIQDSNYRDPQHPKFDILPPLSIKIPADPQEMGPQPEPGKLLHIDQASHTLQIYNTQTQSVETVPYTEAGHGASNAIEIRNGRETMLVTVAEKYLALPADTWKSGDMVRYYYKDAAQALRLMNVSKTKLE